MIRVTFVCLGNICRSPMAQLVFEYLISQQGLAHSFYVDSFATSTEELGNPIYPKAVRTLAKHGIGGKHTAKCLSLYDLKNFDYILVMDSSNLMDVLRLSSGINGLTVAKLCDYTPNPRDVADPWYTGNFEQAFADIYQGCQGFLAYCQKHHANALDYDKRH